MKKSLFFICVLLVAAMLCGCVGTTVIYSECTCDACQYEDATTKPTQSTALSEKGAVKTGLAVEAKISGENARDESDGKASFDITLAAVNVDENGVITSCVIDSLGADATFDASGSLTFDANAELLTKNELGENYGMKLYAGSKYEWYEQAAAFSDYAIGKTVDELKNGAVNESGYAADADLATSATIYLGGYVSAIEKAVANASYLGAQAQDALTLASISSFAESTNGNIALTVDVTALTKNGDVITSCQIDSLQATVTVDENGAITSDLSTPPQTKNELGENYGMKLYAGAKYEWYEQAENFAAYVTGKTAAEVEGIAVTESGKAADADLATSVTVSVGGFLALILKAATA